MRKACIKAGLPEPQFEEYQGFRVIFRKDIYTEEYLKKMGLNERQIKAVMFVKEKGKITNKDYQELCEVRKRQATDDLKELEDKGILERVGITGKGTYYILKGRQRGKRGIKGAPKGQKPHERRTEDAKEEFKEYFKKTAEGVILEHIRGIREKATLRWALGSLKEMIEHGKLSFNEIQNIILEIEAKPSLYLLDKFPERGKRLKELEQKLQQLKISGKEA